MDECEKSNPPKLQHRTVVLRRVPPAEAVGTTALAVGLHKSTVGHCQVPCPVTDEARMMSH